MNLAPIWMLRVEYAKLLFALLTVPKNGLLLVLGALNTRVLPVIVYALFTTPVTLTWFARLNTSPRI